MSSSKKNTHPVFDHCYSMHYGAALGPVDALFGVRIKDTLAWPPEQTDKENTVEAVPDGISYLNLNRGLPIDQCISPTHEQILTGQRDVYIDEPELFGGDQRAGGVRGMMAWLPGRADQTAPAWFARRLRVALDRCPGFRGVASVIFTGARKPQRSRSYDGLISREPIAEADIIPMNSTGFVWGANLSEVPPTSLRIFRRSEAPPLSAWVESVFSSINRPADEQQVLVIENPKSEPRRKPETEDEKLRAGGGFPTTNPAAAIYEMISSGAYDVSAGPDAMDADSFVTAARIFSKERMGVSFLWGEQASVKEIVQELSDHTGAAVFVHPRTGLYTIRLMRPDHVFDDLSGTVARPELTGFHITPSNAVMEGDLERKSHADIVNSLDVKYTEDETGEERAITLIDQTAVVAAGGAVNSDTRNYYMFRSEAAARAAGERDLNVVSRPLMKCSFSLNRSGWALAPFDVIRVTWPSEGIEAARFRILSVDYGSPKDRRIKIDVIEDVFSITPKRMPHAPQPGLWSPEPTTPALNPVYVTPAPAQLLLARGVSYDDLADMDAQNGAAMAHLISSPGSLAGAEVLVRTNSGQFPDGGVLLPGTPRAVITAPLPAEETSTIPFYELDFGPQERDVDPGDVLVIVRPRPSMNITGFHVAVPTRLTPTNLPEGYYGDAQAPTDLPWGIGAAAIAIDPDSDRFASGDGLAPLWTEELAVIRSVNRRTGEAVITRGAFDTVPAPVPAGSWIFHLTGAAPVPGEAISGEGYYSIYRPHNASGAGRSLVGQRFFKALARQELPARPGNVRIQIGDDTFPIGSKASIDEPRGVIVRWAARNRLLDDASPAEWGDEGVSPEPDQSAYVRVWRRVRARASANANSPSPAVLVAQFYDLTGNSFVIPPEVFANSMTDPDWNDGRQQYGGWSVDPDLASGAAFAIEVGAQRMEAAGTSLTGAGGLPLGGALFSAQPALLLVDIGTEPGGWGNDWGNNYGG